MGACAEKVLADLCYIFDDMKQVAPLTWGQQEDVGSALAEAMKCEDQSSGYDEAAPSGADLERELAVAEAENLRMRSELGLRPDEMIM
jgi:hypothetical protein